MPSAQLTAIDLMPTQDSYWLGRSHKCDITAHFSASNTLSKSEKSSLEWGKSMISNRHCRIFQQSNGGQIVIEDNSGNGTFINQQTHLRKGETRILHSGDEICLVNMETLRKKISSYRVIQRIAQQFSFIIVQSKTRKSCVNPRAMNYNFGRGHFSSSKNESHVSPVFEKIAAKRIETFYDMREILGDGTSGQVRRAIHRQSGEEKAVKIISLRRHVNVSIMEREVKLLQSLNHPYIVKLEEVFVRHGEAMYLVMEIVKGGDLFDSIIEKQRYTAVEARRTMRRLLSAVYYLHNTSNIVHRDLKPENILCSSPTHVKLADFGLAKIVKPDGLKTFCGTPAYFAPEVLQRRHTVSGQGRYGKPADMWSLGVILYILLTGKPPFDPDMEESSNLFEVDFESDVQIWSKLLPAKDLVQKLLCLDPQRRLTVAQACDHSWINMEDGDTHCHPLEDPAVSRKHSINQESPPNNKDNATTQDVRKNSDSTHPKEKETSSVIPSTDSLNLSSVDNMKSSEAKVGVAKKSSVIPSADSLNSSSIDNTKSSEAKVGVAKEKEASSVVPSTDSMNLSSVDNTKSSEAKVGVDGTEALSGEKSSDIVTAIENTNGERSNQEAKKDHVAPCDISRTEPRLPLTRLNFNKRSNDFRKRIIKEVNPCPTSLNGSEKFESPSGKTECQKAVTPTSSDAKTAPESFDRDTRDDDDKIEDPILSQFSTVSSVESFSDSSIIESSKTDQAHQRQGAKKRQHTEDKTTNSKSPKHAKTCANSKQTTLNSWIVKKG